MSFGTRETLEPAGPRSEQPASAVRPVPVDVRSASLGVLAVLACVFTLRWARAVFIPVTLGLMLSYALSPIVTRLYRWRIPRAVGAAGLLIGIIGGAGSLVYAFSDDAATLIESLPQAAQRLRLALRDPRQSQPKTLDNVQKAAVELQRAADGDAASTALNPPGVTRVVVEPRRFNIRDYLLTGTLGLVTVIGQGAVVILLAFFMLVSGDSFRRKMVKLAGPRLSQKRITVEGLDEITALVQRYLLVQVLMSLIVGLATWLLFAWIGLQQSAVWGLAAGITNLVPYLGAVLIVAGSMLVAFMQFGTLETAVLIGSVSLGIHGVIGNLLAPWLIGRAGRMSPVTVFVGVLIWGWLWGAWGLLLGIPVLLAIKVACDRIEDLKPIGEFLGT